VACGGQFATNMSHFNNSPATVLASPTAFEIYVDVPFNIWLFIILIFTYGCALRSRRLLLFVVLGVSATIVVFDRTSSRGEMIKIMAELPLGLGSVLAFLAANRSFQTRNLSAFTTYVNFAVYGNIGMMVLTPAGGTFRGMCSKFTCAVLFLCEYKLSKILHLML
jgi:hypothetical protein